MKKSTLLSILLSGAATGLVAQTKISGKIFDKDGHPIKSTTASLLHLADSSLIMQADAAKDGSFLLHTPKNGNYLIRYSSIGYTTLHSRAYQLAGTVHTSPPIFLLLVEHLMETAHVIGKQASVRLYADKMVV